MISELCLKIRMDINNEIELLALREEYEQSGLSATAFAKSKEVDHWKMKYALRKALIYKSTTSPTKVSFKKLSTKSVEKSNNELRIKTSYGAEIIIPL